MRHFIFACGLCFLAVAFSSAGTSPKTPKVPKENWSLEHEEILSHPEAELLVRHGNVNNFGFGWPAGFDPFTGAETPLHTFPWKINPKSAKGTDFIMVPSSYKGAPPKGVIDGYTVATSRPDNLPVEALITFKKPAFPIRSAMLQIFADDLQSSVFLSKFQVTMNGKRVPEVEEVINALVQSGPIGKLVTVQLPDYVVRMLDSGKLVILIDDPTTGAGDGYAFDFFRLLINPRGPKYQGTLIGKVTNPKGEPIANAFVSAGNVVRTQTKADGTYELKGVPAGHATLIVAGTGHASKTVAADLVVGKTVRLDVTLDVAKKKID